jgi:hypothetical protein
VSPLLPRASDARRRLPGTLLHALKLHGINTTYAYLPRSCHRHSRTQTCTLLANPLAYLLVLPRRTRTPPRQNCSPCLRLYSIRSRGVPCPHSRAVRFVSDATAMPHFRSPPMSPLRGALLDSQHFITMRVTPAALAHTATTGNPLRRRDMCTRSCRTVLVHSTLPFPRDCSPRHNCEHVHCSRARSRRLWITPRCRCFAVDEAAALVINAVRSICIARSS